MTRAFPEHFQHRSWNGIRVRAFPEREDAFQQLVGDVLREAAPGQAIIVPTAGPDGSIDAYLESPADLSYLFPGAGYPLIVECKDNDDGRDSVGTNITSAWSKVEQKLRQKAKEGWPDAYGPWKKARGYLYITSAVIPSVSVRSRLQNAIEKLFNDLRAEGRSAIEKVKIADWSDLRAFLDRYPRMADQWLGTGLSALRSYREHLDSFEDFETYLRTLKFVELDATNPAHPDRLLELVNLRSQAWGGVLLTGPGGVGKTRTLLEVAGRADAGGWRVMFITHAKPSVTLQELADVALQQRDSKVLFICDYLDQFNLEFDSFGLQLKHPTRERNVRIGFLASARTDRPTRRIPGRAAFFDNAILFDPGKKHAHHVIGAMIDQVAPTALARFGERKIRELIGNRPTIALLLLQYLERKACVNRLADLEVTLGRVGNLVDWLRRRLHEDDLGVRESASPLLPERVEPQVVVASAVLAAAPASESELRDIAARVARQLGSKEDLRPVVAALRDLGWLCGDEILSPAHDTVTDYVLLEILRTPSNAVRNDVLAAVLAPVSAFPLDLGDYAIVCGRIHTAAGEFDQPLGRALQTWLEEQAPIIGKALIAAEPGTAFSLFWDLQQCAPWFRALIRDQWHPIVVPWLECHGTTFEARFGLFTLLLRKEIPAERALKLCQTADEWLGVHGIQRDALPILMTLLDRADVPSPIHDRASATAWRWYEAHKNEPDAPSVLAFILEGKRVPSNLISKTADAVLEVCAAHSPAAQWSMPLALLCIRDDLNADVQAQAKTEAWRWLRVFRNDADAGLVLNMLCAEPSTATNGSDSAIEIALEWLELHPLHPSAGLLLNTLSEKIEGVYELAWSWFDHNRHQFWVCNILPLIIEAEHISNERLLAATNAALEWVETYASYVQARPILHQLFQRLDLDPAITRRVDEVARAWLERNREEPFAGVVIGILLGRYAARKEESTPLVGMAFEWLATHSDEESAGFVSAVILLLGLAPQDALLELRHQSLRWIGLHGESTAAGMLIGALLARRDQNSNPPIVIESMQNWLRIHGRELEAAFPIHQLLELVALPPDIDKLVLEHAVEWLDLNGSSREAWLVIPPVLRQLDQPARVVERAHQWLERFGHRFESGHVLAGLLHAEFDAPTETVLAAALKWHEVYGTRTDALMMNVEIARMRSITTTPLQQIVSWLENHKYYLDACRVFRSLLDKQIFVEESRNRIVSTALTWLSHHEIASYSVFVIHFVLSQGLDEDLALGLEFASNWTHNSNDPDLQWIIHHGIAKALLKFPAGVTSHPELLRNAVDWLFENPTEPVSGEMAASISVICTNDHYDWRIQAEQIAIEWLGKNEEKAHAYRVLEIMLEQECANDAAQLALREIGTRWVLRHTLWIEPALVMPVILSLIDGLELKEWGTALLCGLALIGTHGVEGVCEPLWKFCHEVVTDPEDSVFYAPLLLKSAKEFANEHFKLLGRAVVPLLFLAGSHQPLARFIRKVLGDSRMDEGMRQHLRQSRQQLETAGFKVLPNVESMLDAALSAESNSSMKPKRKNIRRSAKRSESA